MKKRELEVALRAAAKVACDKEFFVIGTQAVHAYCRRPPAEVLISQECDLYPKNRPETASLIDQALGRGSRFARLHGFYVDVVAPEIATLPSAWQSRLQIFDLNALKEWPAAEVGQVAGSQPRERLRDEASRLSGVEEGDGAVGALQLEVKNFRNSIL